MSASDWNPNAFETYHHNDIEGYCYSAADVLVIGNSLDVLEVATNHCQTLEQ